MRNIQFIVLHCAATQPEATPEAILHYWHTTLGWKNPGYHYLVQANGTVHPLLPLDQVANGVYGLNDICIHLSYIGGVGRAGLPMDTRTAAQRAAFKKLLDELLPNYPTAKVAGHYHFDNKACPSFDVPKWLKEIGLPAVRIYDNGKPSPVKS